MPAISPLVHQKAMLRALQLSQGLAQLLLAFASLELQVSPAVQVLMVVAAEPHPRKTSPRWMLQGTLL